MLGKSRKEIISVSICAPNYVLCYYWAPTRPTANKMVYISMWYDMIWYWHMNTTSCAQIGMHTSSPLFLSLSLSLFQTLSKFRRENFHFLFVLLLHLHLQYSNSSFLSVAQFVVIVTSKQIRINTHSHSHTHDLKQYLRHSSPTKLNTFQWQEHIEWERAECCLWYGRTW